MLKMKPGILRNLHLALLGFALSMGVIFPLYVQFFVDWIAQELRGVISEYQI